MQVFKVTVDPNEFQLLLPTSDSDYVYDMLYIDGRPKADRWKELEMYIHNPLQKRGNFFALSNGGAIVCDKEAVAKLSHPFFTSVELLPVMLEDGTELYLLNVVDCVNALDQKESVFDYYKDGSKGRILEYVFHNNRFSESTIFKIPETVGTEIFTYTGIKDISEEFYYGYTRSGLSGLSFNLTYSNEK